MGRKFKLTFSTRPAKKIMLPSETTISGFLLLHNSELLLILEFSGVGRVSCVFSPSQKRTVSR